MARWDNIVRKADGEEIPGLFHLAFIHNGNTYYLSPIKIYKDGMIDCWGLVDVEGFKRKVAEGWVVTSLPEGAEVSMTELRFKATDAESWVVEAEFVKEVIDDIEWLNGRPTADDRCLAAYEAFEKTPTEAGREALREAYEAVPEHNRLYILGDMDVKDIPIRMILYGEQEIENWSHLIVAKEEGMEPLPSIEVPKVSEG